VAVAPPGVTHALPQDVPAGSLSIPFVARGDLTHSLVYMVWDGRRWLQSVNGQW
jgi:hypothetical protein